MKKLITTHISFFYNSEILLRLAKLHKRYKEAKEAERHKRGEQIKEINITDKRKKQSSKT
jgi:hypothetical protein